MRVTGRRVRRVRGAELLLLVAGLGAGLVAAEVGLRIYSGFGGLLGATLDRRDPYRVIVEPHGFRGYRPRPGTEYTYRPGIVATSNALSYRGPLVAIPKPAGTFRVILLGGSATHGFGVNDHETIDAYMRELLAERYPGRAFEVVNLAYDGYDSYQLLARLRSDGLRLEPDLIIVNSGINDVRNARFQDIEDADPRTVLWSHVITRLEEEQRRGGPSLGTRLKHHSYLARLPGTLRFLAGRDPATAAARPDDVDVFPDAVEYYARNLRAIAHEAAEARDARIPVLFSTAPSSFQLSYLPPGAARRSYWLATPEATQKYRDRLARRTADLVEELRARGLPVALAEHTLAPDMFLDDAHLTPTGNRMVAETFVAAAAPFIGDD